MCQGNFSAFLAGAKSLSVRKMSKLLEVLNMDRMQLAAKFSAKPAVSGRILELQANGERITLDENSVWVSTEGGSGDPNKTRDITNTWKVNG